MKLLVACLAMLLLLLLSLVPSSALYVSRNSFEESAQRPSGVDLRRLLTGVRPRRSRPPPLCKRMKQEVPNICADDVECQRHYLQYVDNMVRMLDAGRRRR